MVRYGEKKHIPPNNENKDKAQPKNESFASFLKKLR